MKKSDIEFVGFQNYLLEKGNREKTIEDYVRHMKNFQKWLHSEGSNLDQLTRYDVQQYIKHLQDRGNKASTLNPKYSAIVAYVRHLGQSHLVDNIQRPEVRHSRHISPKSLPRTDRNRLFREVERSGNLRSIAIVYFSLYTGLRVSELTSLNQDDVHMGERSGNVIIRDGKGGIARTVPLPSEARYHLRHYLETREDNDPSLFLSNFKKRMSKRSVQRIFEKLGIHAHMLRHTYGRELVSSGIDIATVAELMGHSDVNVTRRYAAPSMKDLEQTVEKVFG
ncbi:recombinase XerC [Cytobacillus sp. NCCP-133]|nr:recombinase XerC [Cytobacillus sp. NCCP-133]